MAAMGRRPSESLWSRLVYAARAHPAVAFVGVLVVAALVYVASVYLIPSERRQVKSSIDAIVEGLEEGNPDKVLEHVSPYFDEEGVSRERLARALQGALMQSSLDRINVAIRQIDVRGQRAAASLYVTAVGRSPRRRGMARSSWDVMFEKSDGRWLVISATPLRLNGRRIGGLRTVIPGGI